MPFEVIGVYIYSGYVARAAKWSLGCLKEPGSAVAAGFLWLQHMSHVHRESAMCACPLHEVFALLADDRVRDVLWHALDAQAGLSVPAPEQGNALERLVQAGLLLQDESGSAAPADCVRLVHTGDDRRMQITLSTGETVSFSEPRRHQQ